MGRVKELDEIKAMIRERTGKRNTFRHAKREDVERLVAWLQHDSGYTPHTVSDYLFAIKRPFKFARFGNVDRETAYPEEAGRSSRKSRFAGVSAAMGSPEGGRCGEESSYFERNEFVSIFYTLHRGAPGGPTGPSSPGFDIRVLHHYRVP